MKRGISKNRLRFCIRFLSFYFALHGRAATHFFCFAKKSKQKKATPVAGLAYAKLPSSTRILAAGANSLRSNIAHPSPAKIRSDSAAPREGCTDYAFQAI
ncbi:hypothetical protein ACFQ3H_06280 [Paralysiella testudinis]|uniref:hypothetical protein n=1 Tax=Paralysiella testudinis TaxID=2809020 RepID=UPI0036260DED